MARLIKVKTDAHGITFNTMEDVEPRNGKDFRLSELQEFVGGYIEIVRLKDDKIMVVNEEGALEPDKYKFNATASGIKMESHGFYEGIYGNVLICNSNQVL